MTDQTTTGWPKFPDGTTDWETVFEDPDTGLISLIGKSRSPAALRQCALVVVRQLHTRKNDPEVVERLVADLEQLLPDSLPADMLPKVADAITTVLRQIKDDRISRAARHSASAAMPQAAANDDHDGDQETAPHWADNEDEDLAETDERRRPGPSDAEIPSFRLEQKKPPYAIYGGVAAAMIAVTAATYFVLVPSTPQDADTNKRLIVQMQQAAKGEGPDRHVYGGSLSAGEMAGRTAVTAERVPSNACEQVAWTLASRGNVMISGVMPNRVQPAVLKKLCAGKLLGATLIWLPRKTK